MFVSLFLPGVKEVIITLVLDLVILDILTGQLLHVLNTSSYNKSQVFKWLHIRFVLFLCLDHNMIIHKEKDPEQVFNQQSSSRETKQVTFSWITSKSCIVDIFWSFGENTNNNNAEKMYWLVKPPKINCQNKKNNHLFSHLTVYIWNIWIFGSECTIMDVQVFLTHSFFTEQFIKREYFKIIAHCSPEHEVTAFNSPKATESPHWEAPRDVIWLFANWLSD